MKWLSSFIVFSIGALVASILGYKIKGKGNKKKK